MTSRLPGSNDLAPSGGVSARERLDRNIVIGFFAILFALNLYFVKPSLGPLPVRSAFAMLMLMALVAVNHPSVRFAVLCNRAIIYVILGLGIVGVLLSIARGEMGKGLSELASVHFQAIVLLLLSSIGAYLLGPRTIARMLITFILISCLFGVLQWLGFSFAFSIRNLLGMTYDDIIGVVVVEPDRFPGLAYSTIYLANQSLIAFALALLFKAPATNETRDGLHRIRYAPAVDFDLKYLLLWGVIVAVISTVGGNRSPILGLVIFFPIFLASRGVGGFVLALSLTIIGLLLFSSVRDILAGFGLRIAETGDRSSNVRIALLTYGQQLFWLNPFGYGLGFDSRELYMQQGLNYGVIPNADMLISIINLVPLHNYPITTLNRYGIFVIPFAVFVLYKLWKKWRIALFFVPYIVNMMFHNLGPLDSDYVIWCAIGICTAQADIQKLGERYREVHGSVGRRLGALRHAAARTA